MFVEFLEVSYSNFLSYGAKTTTFKLKQGMNLITGTNGCGKSVILDAVSFGLFGQPYRKIRMAELINRRNKKHLIVEISFRIASDLYKITRGLNPAKLEVTKNDEPLELLSSKKLTQSEIDKILGINHELFRQIISLAISYNRPFLSMPAGDKRDIIENIFGIKIFGEMLKILKRNTSGVKTQVEISKKTIDLLENTIRGLKKQVRDTKVAQKDFAKNKKEDKQNIQDKIDKYQKEIDTLTKTKHKNEKEIISIDSENLSRLAADIYKAEKIKEECDFKLKNIVQDERMLNENNFCPSCKQNISDEHRNRELGKLLNLQRDIMKDVTTNRANLRELNEQNNIILNQIERNNELKHNNEVIDDRLVFYRTEIESLKLDIETIDTRSIKFNIESLEATLAEKSEDYINVYKKYKEFQKASKTNDTVSMILSEEGVKSYFFKKLIPLLNGKVNEILNKFDLPLQITFNDLMEEEIHNYTNGNYVVNYFSLSEGEKKRIDIAILLAFINVTKIINNWQCNLILMDELLDSSVDGEGLDKMIECLRTYANDVKSCCIYLISHRALDSNFFNSIYTVRKNHGFSEIEIKSN